MTTERLIGIGRIALTIALALTLMAVSAPAPAKDTDGYPTLDQVAQQLSALAQDSRAELRSLGTTATGADIPLLVVSGAADDEKPAIAVVGDTGGAHAGVPLVIGMARDLLKRLDEPDQAGLLDRVTFYFIPLPSPDEYARLFDVPFAERQVNANPSDDDFDFQVDEDGYEDLNGDGLITMMRVRSDSGSMRTDPDDPRVMIDADASKDEEGEYDLYTEGIDNDGDGKFNEDPPGGVDFSRNFTFNYPYFEAGAGVNQVSEPETRAVADFMYDHPNIAMVLSFAEEDNLVHTWRPGDTKGGPKTGIDGRDEAAYKYMAELYRDLLPKDAGVTKAPPSGPGAGSFVEWAYYHFGRWSLAARPWWPGEPPKQEEAEAKDGGDKGSGDDSATSEEKPKEKEEPKEDVGNRGKDDIAVLKWIDYADPSRFVPWQKIDHPDFPGKTVEVGGFSPFAALLPPADELPQLASMHTDYLLDLAGLMPQLEMKLNKLEKRGDGVYRMEVEVTNLGYLPTASALGDDSRQLYPLQYKLKLPDGASLLDGHKRWRMGTLEGKGGSAKIVWLIDSPNGGDVGISVYSPSVGKAALTLNLETAGASNE